MFQTCLLLDVRRAMHILKKCYENSYIVAEKMKNV